MTDMPAYTREELNERARSIVRATQFDSTGVRNADLSYGSDYDIWARMLGGVAFLIQESGNSGRRALDKAKSFGAFLREHASIAGIGATIQETTQVAVAATGKLAVRASTSANQSLVAGSTLYSADGIAYTVDTTISTGVFASRTFTAGHRSKRDMVFQGSSFLSAGGTTEIYEYAPTGELFCPRAVLNNAPYRYCQPYLALVDDPELGDVFTRVPGVVAAVTAVVAGASGNREPRDLLTMSPWTGTFSQATVQYIDGGRDALTTSQMQQGLRDLYGTRLDMMTLEEIRRLALETPRTNLRQVFVYPAEFNHSTEDFTIGQIGQMRSIGTAYDAAAVVANLSASSTPVDQFQSLAHSHMEPVDWLLTLRVSPDFSPDWKYNPTFAQLFTGVSTITRIKHTVALPTGLLAVGDRVIVSTVRGAGNDEDPCLVERVVSAVGSDYIDVSEDLPYVPSRAVVSQSGPYGEDLINAIDAYFDGQAPYIANQYRYPSPDAADALDAFRGAVSHVPGIVDVVVSEPSGAAVLSDLEVYYPLVITIRVWT
jgi:hypothetical protein